MARAQHEQGETGDLSPSQVNHRFDLGTALRGVMRRSCGGPPAPRSGAPFFSRYFRYFYAFSQRLLPLIPSAYQRPLYGQATPRSLRQLSVISRLAPGALRLSSGIEATSERSRI
jgi:hypothetical protein